MCWHHTCSKCGLQPQLWAAAQAPLGCLRCDGAGAVRRRWQHPLLARGGRKLLHSLSIASSPLLASSPPLASAAVSVFRCKTFSGSLGCRHKISDPGAFGFKTTGRDFPHLCCSPGGGAEPKLGGFNVNWLQCQLFLPIDSSSYGGRMMLGRLQLKVTEKGAERAKPVLRFLPVGDQNLKKVITRVLEH